MKRLAVFASGNGGNFEAIVKGCISGAIDAKVFVLIVDKENCFAIERAKKLNVPCVYVNSKSFEDRASYEQHLISVLAKYNIDLICLAGYMRIVGQTLLNAYCDRIINIHPALLPSFKGATAISDAVNYGVKVTGVTVHFVSEQVDGGRIIAQEAINIDGMELDEVTQYVHEVEHTLFIKAIKLLIDGGTI